MKHWILALTVLASTQAFADKVEDLSTEVEAEQLEVYDHKAIDQQARKEALALEQWETANSLLSTLLEWASQAGEQEEYQRLQGERIRLKELAGAFEVAERTFQVVTAVFSKSEAAHPELLPVMEEAIEELKRKVDRYGTFMLQRRLLRLQCWACEIRMDYEQSLGFCREIEYLFDENPFFAHTRQREGLAFDMMNALFHLKRYAEAQELAESSKGFFIPGDPNWFAFQDLNFKILLHTKKYEEAYQLVQKMRRSRRFESQTESEKDRWNLNRLFGELFTGRKVPFEIPLHEEKPGDVMRGLLKLFPSFRNDYTGHYVSAIILEILILLQRKHGHRYLIDRIDSLLKFRQRHLKVGYASQSASFIEMLRLAVKHDFKRSSFLREAEPLFQQMLTITQEDPIQKDMVLPYEMLYHAIVARLPEEAWVR